MSYEKVKTEIRKVLGMAEDVDKYNAYPDDYEVDAFVDRCVREKAALIELLSKHPNWDAENLRIVVNGSYSRPINRDEARSALGEIANYLRIDTDPTSELFTLGSKLALTLGEMSGYGEVPEGITEYFRTVFPPLEKARISDGARCTKAVKRMLDQYHYETLPPFRKKEIDRAYARYGDAMNNLTITKPSVLSVNPCDFLLMSYGNSWQSCHSIVNGGGWQAGCLSYALDKITMLFYAVSEDADMTRLTFQRKELRECFFWDGKILVGSRLYPANDDLNHPKYKDCRTIVENLLAKSLDAPDMWRKHDWRYTYESRQGRRLHYADYDNYSDFRSKYPGYVNSFVVPEALDPIPELDIGADDVPCLCCGGTVYDSTQLFCTSCADTASYDYCYLCDMSVREDDMHYVDGEDERVCDDCWNNDVYTCEHCGRDYFERNMQYLNGIGWVCDGDVNEYGYCEECREYYHYEDLNWDEETGTYYCDMHYSELIEQREEEEREEATEAILSITDKTEPIETRGV